MNEIVVEGIGAVSPAGWGVEALRLRLNDTAPIPTEPLQRPGWSRPLRVRRVPSPPTRHEFLRHPRVRRVSAITRFAVSSAYETLGHIPAPGETGRLGIVFCTMCGCVQYTERFLAETLEDPPTASPLIFPETVFNAPASHLATVLGVEHQTSTLLGDGSCFLQGLALATEWLNAGEADRCLVVAAEETSWTIADAFRLFSRSIVLSEGAAALLLTRQEPRPKQIRLAAITSPQVYGSDQTYAEAVRRMTRELQPDRPGGVLLDSAQGIPHLDAIEAEAWSRWSGSRISVKKSFGEGLTAAVGWQCVAAVDALRQGSCQSATVSVVGSNQQAIGACFVTAP